MYAGQIQEVAKVKELFNTINSSDNDLYHTNFPTTFNNFSTISAYYQPFIDGVKDYLDNWRNISDVSAPNVVNDLTTTFDGFHYVKLNWTPIEDTNFKSYKIYYDQVSLSPSQIQCPIRDNNKNHRARLKYN